MHGLYRHAGDGERRALTQRMSDRHITRHGWCVVGVLIETTETNVHVAIGTFYWHHNGELFNNAARVGRRNFAQRAFLVKRDLFVTVNRQWCDVIAFFKDGLRAFHVMEVRVNHGGDWSIRDGAQLSQCSSHFLNRFTRIDGDDAFRCLNECLVRKTVANESPHT